MTKIAITEEEIQYRLEKYSNIEDVLNQNLKCTVCCTDLSGQIAVRYACRRHIVLQVLVCKKCKEFYGDGYLSTEEDGGPKYCRWCGDGGRLFLCDKCDSGFCKPCVRRNFSRSVTQNLSSEKWSCFICAPELLYDLRATAWAARELCKKRREEEKEKSERKGKKCRRPKKLSSLEPSRENSPQKQPKSVQHNLSNQGESTENVNPVFPTSLSKVNTDRRKPIYKNPLLHQAKTELRNYFSQLVDLQKSERDAFGSIENEIMNDDHFDSFLAVEQLELMMQEYVIRLIDGLNRVSTDLSSRLTELRRVYLIEEDRARENGAFGGECTFQNDGEPGNVVESSEISDQDDVISVSSSHFSEDSLFSSVSTSRNERENCCENDSDSDVTRTGFSMANMGAASTPFKEEKLLPVEHIKMEVFTEVNGEGEGEQEEGLGGMEEKGVEEEEEKEKKEDGERTFTQDEAILKLLEDYSDSDAGEDQEEEEMGGGLEEERVESEEEEEEEVGGGLGEESLESDDYEEEEEERAEVVDEKEEDEEEEMTLVENKDIEGEEEVSTKEKTGESCDKEEKEEEEEKERENREDGERQEDEKNDNGISVRTNETSGKEEVEKDSESDKNVVGLEMEVNNEFCSESVLENAKNSDVTASVEGCQEPTDEKKTGSSDDETDYSQNVNDKTTLAGESEKLEANSSCDSDAATVFELGDDKVSREKKKLKEKENEKENNSTDSECETRKEEKESKSKDEKTEDEWDWDEIRRLAHLGSLDRKRKRQTSFSTNSEDSAGSETSKRRSSKKKSKKSGEKYDILDNLNDDNVDTDNSGEDDDDDDFFKFGSTFQTSKNSAVDAFGFSDSGEPSDRNSSGSESGKENEEGPAKKTKGEDKGEPKAESGDADDKKEPKQESDDDIWDLKRVSPQKQRPSWKRDDLLSGKLSSSDEESKRAAAEKRRKTRKERKKIKREKEMKQKTMWLESSSDSDDLKIDSDSDESDNDDCKMLSNSGSDSSIQFVLSKSKRTRKTSSSGSIHSISSINDDDDDLRLKKKSSKICKRKKRIKINLDVSSDSTEKLASDSAAAGSSCEEVGDYLNTSSQSQLGMSGQGRRNIRRVMKDEDVAEATRKAIREEEERKQRVIDRQQKYNDSFGLSDGSAPIVGDRLVLDFDTKSKKELICVNEKLVSQMKPHQVQGVKFMWDACFESLEAINEGEGGGCILAHCMGLGKTFQVVSLVHTLLMHRLETKVRRVLICCPLSTVLNWYSEFQKWLSKLPFGQRIATHHLANDRTPKRRAARLNAWHEGGGVMIIGYEMFRSLTNEDKKGKEVKHNYKMIFSKTLLKPGADLVVCDEGHTLKNLKTALSKQMNKIHTKRRIVLTGTPLQNNLIEYHCMMNFVKPNYLGTKNEFINRFVNPITNGQFADSTEYDVKVMKRRAHVLHKMLDGITQRRDYRELMTYLPPKKEYVISIRLTELQVHLMKTFLEKVVVTKRLFKDFQSLNRLWSHPLSLKFSKARSNKKPEKDGKVGDIENAFNDHSNDSDVQFVPSGVKKNDDEEKTKDGGGGGGGERENDDKEKEEEWWEKLVTEEQMNDVTNSSKLVLLFAFLKECATLGDKVLLFSQSLASLDVIEYFLNKLDQLQCCHKEESGDKENQVQQQSAGGGGGGECSWKKDVDYFRLDGSTTGDLREKWTKTFNNPTNRSRLFLISTRAGGLGINLTAANRVILFDASWNPSNDIQSIFRVFRFGQDKPCYIYRFIAQGTMEEKIYERQISKLSMSIRVVDEQQVNRYYSQTDLQELYKFTPADPNDRPVPTVPKDRLLCEMLEEHSALIYKVFMHDSLLDHVEEEELDEAEQRAAWEDYKNEKKKALNRQVEDVRGGAPEGGALPPPRVARGEGALRTAAQGGGVGGGGTQATRRVDRPQSSSLQSIPPTADVENLMKMTIPEHDLAIMKRMLMNKYASISPEKLEEMLLKEFDLWNRNRPLAGGAPAGGPSTNALSISNPHTINNAFRSNASSSSRPTPVISTSRPASASNVAPIGIPSTSRTNTLSNLPSTSRTTSSASASNSIPTSTVGLHLQVPTFDYLHSNTSRPTSSTSASNAIPTTRPTTSSNLPSTSRPTSSTSASNAIPTTRPTTSSNLPSSASNAIPTTRPTTLSNLPSTSRPTSSTSASNAIPTSRPTTSSNPSSTNDIITHS